MPRAEALPMHGTYTLARRSCLSPKENVAVKLVRCAFSVAVVISERRTLLTLHVSSR